MFLKQSGGLDFSSFDGFGQQGVERGQLIGRQKITGLLDDALIAFSHLLHEFINVPSVIPERPDPARR